MTDDSVVVHSDGRVVITTTQLRAKMLLELGGHVRTDSLLYPLVVEMYHSGLCSCGVDRFTFTESTISHPSDGCECDAFDVLKPA